MSSYIVDKEHIVYLVEAAMVRIGHGDTTSSGPSLTWYVRGPYGEVVYIKEIYLDSSPEERLQLAQLLLDTNVLAVRERYPDENVKPRYRLTVHDFRNLHWEEPLDPIQVIASCHCYEYQCSDDPDWYRTEAYAFIQALERKAILGLPGMNKAIWGCPAPTWPLYEDLEEVTK